MAIARKDVRPQLAAALAAIPLFAGKQVQCLLDDSLEATKRTMENELTRDRGVLLVIPPLLSSEKEAVAGHAGRVAELATGVVRLRVNAAVNAEKAQLVPEECEDAIIARILELGRGSGALEGLRLGEIGPDGMITALLEDPGLQTKGIFFHVQLTLPK